MKMTMTNDEIHRMIAKQAARGVYLYSHHAEIADMRERLLAEAKDIDRFYCPDDAMVKLAESELHKLRGNVLGGLITAGKKRLAAAR